MQLKANSTGSYSTAMDCGDYLTDSWFTKFDITDLVKAWKAGTYSANAGFILINDDETAYKQMFSCEYSTTSYRPYVTIEYETNLYLSSTSAAVAEGGTVTLVATSNPAAQSVSWSTSDSSVATVSQYGVVTSIKAGTATITASIVDADGATKTATCTIYVTIPNGVYYIKNLNSNYYLHVKNGLIANYSDVYQYSKYSDSTSNNYRIRQMWKIYYLGNGRYSIRPMNKLDMGLDVTGGNVDIYNIGTSDTLSGVPYYGEWTIHWDSNGYVFQNNGSSSLTMQVQNASTAISTTVVASAHSSNANCRWGLTKISSPPSGVYWYNTNIQGVVSGSSVATGTIHCGSSSYTEDLGLVPVAYSPSSNNQAFTWLSSDANIATVGYLNGLISAQNAGNVVITATSQYGGYELALNIIAKSTDPFHYQNIQYMRYVRITGVNEGIESNTDYTISVVKSSMYSNDYCIIFDNINQGYCREIYVSDELISTLANLENGYQEHYSVIPLFNTTSDQENAAHFAKAETDQLVDDGYFSHGSTEYYGAWAYNYVSLLNLLDYWRGVIDTATAAFGVYLSISSFYNSYLMSTSTSSVQLTSSQYGESASIIDDIDDALGGMSYGNKTILSSDSRNATLAQQGYTNPLPYKPQTPVVQYQQMSSTQYVRVYTGNNKVGGWLMRYSDIQGLTSVQIQSKFALPSTPTHYCYVNVPAGTMLYVGVVNQSSISGTLQYELGTIIPATAYGESILLP